MITDLSQAERVFLSKHGLQATDVYDARGQSRDTSHRRAKEEGKFFILGTACGKAGHRLRTRAGHCIQCDTSRITFQKRHTKAGYVYIAGSLKRRLIKVGGCVSLKGREERLQEEAYAGADDWRLLRRELAPEYGMLEQRVHALLQPWSTGGTYMKGVHVQSAREVYACSFSDAARALDQVMNDLSLPIERHAVAPFANQYEFEADKDNARG